MTNILVVFPKLEDAKNIKNILVRGGFGVTGISTTGSQALGQADGLHDGIIICGYKMQDMIYSKIYECLPQGFEMILVASQKFIGECYGNDIVCLSLPLQSRDLISTVDMVMSGIERRRRKLRQQPKKRSEEQEAALREAKEVLMVRNHMTEDEAHKYLQKCSMDSGTNLVETAQMILAMIE